MKIAKLKKNVSHAALEDMGFEKRYDPKTGKHVSWAYVYALNNERVWFKVKDRELIFKVDLSADVVLKYLCHLDLGVLLSMIDKGFIEFEDMPKRELPF